MKQQKLEPQHKHIMRLIERDKDDSGWTSVSAQLYPMLSAKMPSELVVFETLDGKHRARLTDEGQSILNAMVWL